MENKNCPFCNSHELLESYVFCPYCGKKLVNLGVCQRCGFNNPAGANFCQECGTSLSLIRTEKEGNPKTTILEIEPVPKNGITIEFGYSSSSNFDLVVRETEIFPSLKIFGEGKKATYRINFDRSEIESTFELEKYVRGWKSSRIYINGERTTWDAIYSFLWCYEKRCASFKPNLYCFGYENSYDLNIWGCIQARLPFTGSTPWAEWGKWLDKNGTWQFDKDRIRHELQVALFKYQYCPSIQLDLIDDVLSAFPDKVNPTKDKNWKFVESWGENELSPILIIKTKRFGFDESVKMRGVAPNGFGAIRDIIKRMKHKLPSELLK